MKFKIMKITSIGIIALMMLSGFYTLCVRDVKAEENSENELIEIITCSFSKPVIDTIIIDDSLEKFTYDRILMAGLRNSNIPGEPSLPFKSLKILLPPDKDLERIEVATYGKTLLNGKFYIEPGQQAYPIGYDELKEVTPPDPSIYNSVDPYPSNVDLVVSLQKFRGFRILIVNLFPVQYIPKTNEIFYYKDMEINIFFSLHDEVKDETDYNTFRGLSKDFNKIENIVDNPAMTQTYINSGNTLENNDGSKSGEEDGSLFYDYVIVTNNELKTAFQPLIDSKIAKGLQATTVTIEEIYSQYAGIDNQEKIRNFIIDAYVNWSVEYVLLGGDDEIIPCRLVYLKRCGTEADYIPCDLYYAGLDGNWDNDNDGSYGEGDATVWPYYGTGTAGEEADFFAEIYVGRATVDTAEEVTNFVSKTLLYEEDTSPNYRSKALFVGEEITTSLFGGTSLDIAADIIPQFDLTSLYMRDETFSQTAVINKLNSDDVCIINHFGHANYAIVMSLWRSHIDSLTNTKPFFIYSEGCYSAAFDNDTSGSSESVAEHFIYNPTGAFAYIGNTRYGLASPVAPGGPSDLFNWEFFDALSNEGIKNIGKALQDSKEDLIGEIWDRNIRWCYIDLVLLGDPEVEISSDFVNPVAHISSPDGRDIVGDTLDIVGIATKGYKEDATFSHYTLEYGVGSDPTSWSDKGITLACPGGLCEISDDTLATWDTSFVGYGRYTLRLTVTDGYDRTSEDKICVIVDNTIADGWPIDSKGSYFPLVTADIDNDGFNEIIEVGKGDCNTKKIYVWNSDGSNVPGWPIEIEEDFLMDTVIGDIDNDGFLEIIVRNSYNKFYAFNHDGSLVDGWPVELDYDAGGVYYFSSSSLSDIDNDGFLEVIGLPFAINYDGTLVDGFPINITTSQRGLGKSQSIGDIDSDGDLEIIVASIDLVDSKLYAFHHDGSLVNGWPVSVGRLAVAAPALGDINNDGFLEVIIGSQDRKVYAFNHDGSLVDGWPTPIYDVFCCSPALGDIDNDGYLEIVIGSSEGGSISPHWNRVYAFNHDGSLVDGWPVGSYSYIIASQLLADIDNDGNIEILVASADRRIDAFENDGTEIINDEWPKYTSASIIYSTPVIDDVDNDGYIEILAKSSDGIVRLWNIDAIYRPQNVEWGMFQNDPWHTGLYHAASFEGININLFKGWNLVTTPVENDMMASDLAEDISGCLSISKWDAAENTYYGYIVGGPLEFDFQIEDGYGLFVDVESASTFTVVGERLSNVSVSLVDGTNLLGWYDAESTTASKVMRSVENCQNVSIWDAVNQEYMCYRSKSDFDFVIEQGMGYFVEIGPFDDTAPVTTCKIIGKKDHFQRYIGDVTVSLFATDDISGAQTTFYSIDGSSFEVYECEFVVSTIGTHTLNFYSVDNAGNQEEIKDETFIIAFVRPIEEALIRNR